MLNFLPLLAERFARQRLHRARPRRRPPPRRRAGRAVPVHPQRGPLPDGARVLHPPRRQTRAIAWSGGSEPGTEINPAAVAAMAERGIDITARVPQAVDRRGRPRRRRRRHHGLRRRLPRLPRQPLRRLDLDDPAGLDVADVRPIRDDIERRVRALLDELGRPHPCLTTEQSSRATATAASRASGATAARRVPRHRAARHRRGRLRHRRRAALPDDIGLQLLENSTATVFGLGRADPDVRARLRRALQPGRLRRGLVPRPPRRAPA